ncbi:MAG TPA: sulfonate ABC transporter substrate-binding protein [Stellaceae bacterium]|nr:sulfonate ABC transporter substrate-binding protein [Stellaceae bacterium]
MKLFGGFGKGAILLLVFSLLSPPAPAGGPTLRIGYQKYGTLIVLQARGTLEERLRPLGVSVEWVEFPSGPPLLEALNAGSIDFGTAGEAPPVFAQAANNGFVYVGVEPPAPAGEAILVAKDSPIKTVADLRGKRVALNKGSNVHYFLVQALTKAGLSFSDVKPAYLAPADARAAFERANVDAWVIWDPYLAAGQQATEARTLVDGTGIVSNFQFYLAARTLAGAHPELVRAVLDEIAAADDWARTRPQEVVRLLAPRTGLPEGVVAAAAARLAYGVKPLDAAVVAYQQSIADTFRTLGLIPKSVTVRDAVWGPQS